MGTLFVTYGPRIGRWIQLNYVTKRTVCLGCRVLIGQLALQMTFSICYVLELSCGICK